MFKFLEIALDLYGTPAIRNSSYEREYKSYPFMKQESLTAMEDRDFQICEKNSIQVLQ